MISEMKGMITMLHQRKNTNNETEIIKNKITKWKLWS